MISIDIFTFHRNLHNPNFNKQGVTAMSPLFRIPAPFHVMFSAPSDEFHLIKEGVGKLIIKRMLEDTNTVLTREIMMEWSTAFECMAVFSETPRYTRQISTGSMKGSELGIVKADENEEG